MKELKYSNVVSFRKEDLVKDRKDERELPNPKLCGKKSLDQARVTWNFHTCTHYKNHPSGERLTLVLNVGIK